MLGDQGGQAVTASQLSAALVVVYGFRSGAGGRKPEPAAGTGFAISAGRAPINSASLRVIASPRPVPPYLRVVELCRPARRR